MDTIPVDCFIDSKRNPVHPWATGKTSSEDPLNWPMGTSNAPVPNPYLHSVAGSLCALLRVAVRASLGRQEGGTESRLEAVSKGESTILSYSDTFRKTKERFPAASLVHCKIKKRYTNLRILPEEGARSIEQCIHTRPKKSSEYKTGTMESIPHLKAASKHRRWLLLQMQKMQWKTPRNLKN